MGAIDDFLNDTTSPKKPIAGNLPSQIDQFLGLPPAPDPDAPRSSLLRRTVGDPLVSALKGAISVPQAAVGLADIPTMGLAGKAVEHAGVRFKDAQDAAEELYSPEQQRVNKGLEQAQGFLPTLKYALSNPSIIAHQAIQSAPSMFEGALISRGAMALAPKLPAYLAGAIGEGAITAGQNLEQVRSEEPTGLVTPGQVALLSASGALTGGISAAGGKLAQKLGLFDPETLLAAGRLPLATAGQKTPGMATRVAGGALSEGLLQEFPQSYQEQVAQNLAQGKPWDEGAAQQAVLGGLVGGVMGGGSNLLAPREPTPFVGANTPGGGPLPQPAGARPGQSVAGGPAATPGGTPPPGAPPAGPVIQPAAPASAATTGPAAPIPVPAVPMQPGEVATHPEDATVLAAAAQPGAGPLTQAAAEAVAGGLPAQARAQQAATEQAAAQAEAGPVEPTPQAPGFSDTPDFAATFPRPQIEALNAAGRDSMFAGMENDPVALLDAVRTTAQETGNRVQRYTDAMNAVTQGLEQDINVHTGKKIKGTAERAKLVEEAQSYAKMVSGTFTEFNNEFGSKAESAYRALFPHVEPIMQRLAEVSKPKEATNAGGQQVTTPVGEQPGGTQSPGGQSGAGVGSGKQGPQAAGTGQTQAPAAPAPQAGPATTAVTTPPAAPLAKPKTPADLLDFAQAGVKAFMAGDKRIPPAGHPQAQKQWLAGWDKANLEAPVPNTPPAATPGPAAESTPPATKGPVIQPRPTGAAALAQRQQNAIERFVDSAVEQFGLTREEAGKAWDHLAKLKLVKADPLSGQYTLKDGRVWDGEALRRAANGGEAPTTQPQAADKTVKPEETTYEDGEQWWDHDLTKAGRLAVGKSLGIVPETAISMAAWRYMPAQERLKVLAVRGTAQDPTKTEGAAKGPVIQPRTPDKARIIPTREGIKVQPLDAEGKPIGEPHLAGEDKPALVADLREKLSALADRAMNAGDGKLSGQIRGFMADMNESERNLKRAWVDEGVSELEKMVARTEKKTAPVSNTPPATAAVTTAATPAASTQTTPTTTTTPATPAAATPAPAPESTPAPAAVSNYGGKNTVFTADAAAMARELLKKKLGQLSVGIDPEIIQAGITLAGYHIEAGARSFVDYARAMLADLGDVARPFLKSWYNAVRDYPGFDATGLTAYEEVSKTDVATIVAEQPAAPDVQTSQEKQNEPSGATPSNEGKGELRPLGESGAAEGAGNKPGPGEANAPVLEGVPTGNDQATPGTKPADTAGPGAPGEDVAGGEGVPEGGNANIGRPGASGEGLAADGPGARVGPNEPVDGPRISIPTLGNYHIADPKALFGGGPKARFSKNRIAIQTFRAITEEGRTATPAERDALAAYTGWGSFGQELFKGNWGHSQAKKGWETEDRWLRDQLGRDEWESAQASILNAHYTDPPTVQAIWRLIEKMGFTGGRVLEPSIGIGNFFGLMPLGMMERSQLAGIELDKITGGMAQLLYPDANVQIKGYQDSKTADNFYDLIVGNWPFAKDTSFVDRRYAKISPSLHDYFFLKALDQVRPGGLVVGITSSGSMDKAGIASRLEMARKGELIAAFRLPSGAFQEYAGTRVVTDILIFRKRAQPRTDIINDVWLNSSERMTPAGQAIRVNDYWKAHQDHVLGNMTWGHGSTTGRPGMIVERQDDFPQKLAALESKLADDVYAPAPPSSSLSYVTNNTKDRESSVTVADGKLMVVRGEYLVPLAEVSKDFNIKDKKELARREIQVRALVGMRKDYGALIDAERAGEPAELLRGALALWYKRFTDAYGPLNESKGLRILERAHDPFFPSLAALEHETPDGWRPAQILTESTMRKGAKLGSTPTVRDAFVLARNESMNVSIDRIAELTHKSVSDVTKELIDSGAMYLTPAGVHEVSDVYLSGNVRRKLHEAEDAQAAGQDMAHNIKALKEVMPSDMPYYKIEAKMGATWVSPPRYHEFLSGLLNLNEAEKNATQVIYRLGAWKVEIAEARKRDILTKPEATTVHGVPGYSFRKLFAAALNNQAVTVKVRNEDGDMVVDPVQTEEANTKIATMRENFSGWIWGDSERRVAAEKDYNEVMRTIATTKFDGSFLSMVGMIMQRGKNQFDLRQHQLNAIWRGLVNKSGIYAHEVGTGKTFTIGGIAIESRRYGIAKKPLILAHNANSASVAREIQEMYPAAKVLYIDNLAPDRVAITMRQIANDDWDAVIMPHSLLDKLALREETLTEIAREDIAQLEEAALEAAEEDHVHLSIADMNNEKTMAALRSPTAKELVKARNAIYKRISDMVAKSSKEDAISFEDLGVDMMLVDEAHEFKKPPLVTRMKMKGLNTQVSNRSISLRFLADYVKRLNGGTGVHLFTGTPITNTLSEIYNLQRYVADQQMTRDGIKDWDSWFATFADSTTDVEMTSTGDYEATTRLAQFVNVADLRQMIGNYTDIVFADEMPEFVPRPTANGKILGDKTITDQERAELIDGRSEDPVGRPYKKTINSVAPMSQAQRDILTVLRDRAQEFKDATGMYKRSLMLGGFWGSPLVIDSQAPAVGMDPRMYDLDAPDAPELKVNRAAVNVLKHYNEHDLATQVVFVDKGYASNTLRSVRDPGTGLVMRDGNRQPIKERVDTFNLVRELMDRLVEGGIPRNEIEIVNGAVPRDKRMAISDQMNSAKTRVVIGLTTTLGIGVNMQENLRAIHHLDAPWMPGELEQRNGRGWRQGNKWNTVLEYRYITDRIDARRWQVLAVKDRFIKDFLHADENVRIIEGDAAAQDDNEGGDIMASLSEAAGDPRLLLRQKLIGQIERLERRQRSHDFAKEDSRNRLRQLKGEISQAKVRHADFVDDAAQVQAKKDDPFSIDLLSKTYTERTAATAALAAWVKTIEPSTTFERIGNIIGFNIYARWPYAGAEMQVELRRKRSYSVQLTVPSFEGVLRNLGPHAAKEADKARSLEGSIPALEDASKAPYPRADELAKKKLMLDQLQADLYANPTPPPLWLRQGAPVHTKVYVDGESYVVEGHQYSAAGYFVLVDTSKGMRRLPYDLATDESGMPLYEAHPFTAPATPAANRITVGTWVKLKGTTYEIEREPIASPRDRSQFSAQATNMTTGESTRIYLDGAEIVPKPQPEPIPLFGSLSKEEQSWLDMAKKNAERIPQSPTELFAELPEGYAPADIAHPAMLHGNRAGLSAQNTALVKMIDEGAKAQDILKTIARTTKDPLRRIITAALIHSGIMPKVKIGPVPTGVQFTTDVAGREGTYSASYQRSTDTVMLHDSKDPERDLVHEFTHAATVKALEKGGMAARAMQNLYEHVKKFGTFEPELYGMENVGEFVAEAFSNPLFQAELKAIPAMRGLDAKNAWQWFVNAVRSVLGLQKGATNALEQVLTAGQALTVENAAIREGPGEHPTLSRAFGNVANAATIAGVAVGAARVNLMDNIQGHLQDFFQTQKQIGFWGSTVGTMRGVAYDTNSDGKFTHPDFKKVYDRVQHYLESTSRFAMRASDLAQTILPRTDNLAAAWRNVAHATARAQDLVKVQSVIWNGTLGDSRRYLHGELAARFKLTPAQIKMYDEARAAIDQSINDLASTEMFRVTDAANMWQEIDPHSGIKAMHDYYTTSGKDQIHELELRLKAATPDSPEAASLTRRIALLRETLDTVNKLNKRAETLSVQGYAPLMRFGRYTLDVYHVDANGRAIRKNGEVDRIMFRMFDSEYARNRAAREADAEYANDPTVRVVTTVTNPDAYKQFQGMTPETVLLFAKETGVDQLDAYREYLAYAVSERSALQRMFQRRKGIAGFTEDLPRVMAAFITSNARRSATNVHTGELGRAVRNVKNGEEQRFAQALQTYVQDPKEEANKLRGFLFFNFLSGSIASAITNVTGGALMLAPYLQQFTQGTKVNLASIMARALKMAVSGTTDPEMKRYAEQAAQEGLTQPMETHQLHAQAAGSELGKNLYVRSFLHVMAAPFSSAETFNRRTTFYAAMLIAKELRNPDPMEFAVQAIAATQGVYNKGNRPVLGRSALGATIMTFKQFGIAYGEFLMRLPLKQRAIALALLVMASGLRGIPFEEDAEDLIDTIAQALGFNFTSRKKMNEWATDLLGETGGKMLQTGMSGIPGMPLDVQQRLGFGNMIPGTSVLKRSEVDKTRDAIEAIGPVGSVIKGVANAAGQVLAGNYGQAARYVAPLSIQNIARAVDMGTTGFYNDLNGRRVVAVDFGDAVTKAIGFQPQVVGAESRAVSNEYQTVAMGRAVEAEITSKWARGIFQRDSDAVKEAQADLKDYNAKNPTTPIRITPEQIQSRVREMAILRSQRFLKSAPPELRADVGQAVR